nr:DUF4365 domain-containing protein [Armatimonas rosea]
MQNQWQEQFSYAYLRAVAAAAGFQVTKPEMDFCKIDLEISAIDEHLHDALPKLTLQVKCDSDFKFQNNALVYSLDIDTYQRLRSNRTLHPRILVVVTVPRDQGAWVSQTEDELIMRHCAYWKSLEGEPASTNTTAQTVYLPRAQIFDVASLSYLMGRLNQGQRP